MDYYHIRTYTPFVGEEMDAYIAAATITEYQKKADNCAEANGMEWFDEEDWLEHWGYDKDADDYDEVCDEYYAQCGWRFIATEKELAAIEKAKGDAYAKQIVEMLTAIQPGLVEAMQGQTNAALTNGIAAALSPAALAKGESVSEAITRMVKGTPMETVIEKFCENK